MSSEMRELIAKWRSGRLSGYVGLTKTELAVLRVCASELELRLARTEAGADGAKPFGWWIECHGTDGDFGQFVTDRAFVELLRSHGVVSRETALFDRPQDASGDAGFSAAELESLAKCVLASVTPGGFHIPEGWNVLLDKLTAMQAKEAK